MLEIALTAYLGGEPIHALTTGTHYAGVAQGAVDEKTGFESENTRTKTGAPWATTTATADDTRFFEVLSDERLTVGAVVEVANPTPRAILSLVAGNTAELNVVNTNGASTEVDSASTVSTSANLTFLWVGRLRQEVSLALPATASIAHLSDLTGTYGGTASDFGIEIDPADGILKAKVWRYGASPTTLSSGQRGDDGKLWAVVLTISGTDGSLYVQASGGSLSTAVTGTVPAHSSQINQRFRIGRANTLYLPVGTAAVLYFTEALSSGAITNLLSNLRGAWKRDALQMCWVPTAADVTAGTSITDQAGNHNAVTPNAWVELPNTLSAIQYSKPVFGPPRNRKYLRFDGIDDTAATAATLDVPATYSLIYGIRLPRGASPNQSGAHMLYGLGGASNDISARWVSGAYQVTCRRISGTSKAVNGSTVFTADGVWHVVHIAVDDIARTCTVYIDGAQEGQITSISAHVASAVSLLRIGSTAAASGFARNDFCGPIIRIAGTVSAADALAMWQAGADANRDPRIKGYHDLQDSGTDLGSEATTLTVTGAVYKGPDDAPGSISRLVDTPPRSARIIIPWARSPVTELSLRLFDPGNAEASLVVPFVELFDGVVMSGHDQPREMSLSAALSDTGMRRGSRSRSFDLWLTRQEAERIASYAETGRLVFLAARATDDVLGEATRSVYGQVQSVDLKEFYSIADGTTYRYETRVTILEAP